MKDFDSILGFVEELAVMDIAVLKEQHKAKVKLGERITERAREEIGTYQEREGPFPGWNELADSTLYGFAGFPGKIDLGYATENDHKPLERTGEMERSIDFKVFDEGVTVGSESQILLWQEQGTENIPARSVLGLALFDRTDEALSVIGLHTMKALAGGSSDV